MNKPILSICIPTYNRAELLRSALLSLAPQVKELGDEIELIVSDNCSPDHTKDIVEWAQQYGPVHYHRNDENIGAARNILNLVNKLACGEFCWILGDDDFVRPGGVLGLFHYVREDIPKTLQGDNRLLKTIVIKILENAIKFTDRGEIVCRVEPETSEKNDTVMLHFSVSDTGIGIAEDKLDIIFDSFTQIDSSLSRKYEGIGLGLSIAQKLVTLLGGKIWVESKVNQGSTFHFTVKLNSVNLS